MKQSTANNTDPMFLENEYREKVDQFRKAEEAGLPQDQLNTLYQDLKKLRQQIDLQKPVFKLFA